MTEYYAIFRKATLVYALIFLGLTWAAWFGIVAHKKLGKLQKGLLIFFVLMCGFAGAKNYPKVKIVNPDPEIKYIYDINSYATNSYVHLEFSTFALPTDARILFGYMPKGSTNESEFVLVKDLTRLEWENLYSTADGVIKTDVSWMNGGEAWENNWYLGTTYVAPPSVHTNGVLNCYGIRTLDGNALPKRTLVIEHSFITYPPRQMGSYYDSVDDALNAEEFEGERIPYDLEY